MNTSIHPKIFIDARPTMGGIARYTHELSRYIRTSEYAGRVFFYGQGADDFSAASSVHGARRLLRHLLGGAKRIITDQISLPLAAHRSGARLLHSTNYYVPLLSQKPVIVTCYDLSLLHFFSSKKAGLIKYYERFLLCNGLRRAVHVTTISHTIAEELKRHFPFLEKNLSVIYPPLPSFCHIPSNESVFHAGELSSAVKRVLQGPFFLSVGSIEPRKNLFRLLDGWRQAYCRCKIPLVLVGPYGWKQRALVEEQLKGKEGLHWLGSVSDETLSALYKQAIAVVQYSLYEGFDYPVAEAICLGTPVVASDIEVHREVMAGCGLLAATTEADELAAALLEVSAWSEQSLADYRSRAQQQARIIKDNSSVEHYMRIYERVLAAEK